MPEPGPATEATRDRLTSSPLRRVGLILVIGIVFVGFSPSAPTPAQWLLLACGALAAGWLLNSAVVVLAPAMLLALAHTDLGSPEPGPGLWYPLGAGIAGAALLVLLIVRFRARMLATREERRLARAERSGEPPAQPAGNQAAAGRSEPGDQ